MQGPFDQQTEAAGFYMPLLGASPATQFATVVVRPRAGSARRHARAGSEQSGRRRSIRICRRTFPERRRSFITTSSPGNRVIATLFTIFGVVAFILSGVGLYGVMSFSVNQRTQEFGIRMALGADAARILRMVMSQGAWQLAIGLVLGAGGVALLLGVVAAAALETDSLQGQSARSDDLLWPSPDCSRSSPPRPVFCRRVARPASIRSSRCAMNDLRYALR